MPVKKVGAGLLLMTAIIVSACGEAPVAATQPEAPAETVMAEKPASAEEVMEEKAGAEVVADQTTDEAPVEQKATDEAMVAEKAPTEETVTEKAPTEEAMMTQEATAEVMVEDKTSDEAMAAPAWFNAELTDVNTGETFKIADFKGKVVLVETMAVWCPLCLRQQGQVRALHELLGEREDLISLALDIDPNEDAELLQAHANQNGFDWRYAVAPAEVSREIGQLYGAQFLNPPSTPMLIIDRQGEVQLLPFGQKDAQTLQEALTPLLNEG
jgi:thiol-disulfide isomerase/thioredoxin